MVERPLVEYLGFNSGLAIPSKSTLAARTRPRPTCTQMVSIQFQSQRKEMNNKRHREVERSLPGSDPHGLFVACKPL